MSAPIRVVILGGGFAGLYTALHLQRRWPRGLGLELTLVNRENHLLFTPMLHEVAASDLDVTHIVNPIRKLLRAGRFFNGEARRVDLAARTVEVRHLDGGHDHVLPYDYLVLALGSVTNFFGLPGLAQRAFTMKSLGDAIALRNHTIQRLEEADFECAAANRHGLLTFLVAGGGFAGVETIAALHDFVHEALRFYPHLRPSDVRMVLVHPGETILPELDPRLGRYAERVLGGRGVDIRTGVRVTAATTEGVALSDGTEVPARTVVWTAGTAANPTLAGLPCQTARGRLAVNERLELPEWPGVWALGDCAAVPDLQKGGYHPPTAQHAIRQARVAADNIIAAAQGRPGRAFRFPGLGQLAAIGRRSGVAQILGFRFSGFPAWFLWRTIYLAKLPRFERKVRVALDWTLDLVFSKDLVEFQTSRGATVSDPPRTVAALDRPATAAR